MMSRILALSFFFFSLFATPALAQFSSQQEYVVGAGTANAQTASFPNANTLADLIGVPLRIQAGATNSSAATLTINSFAAQNILKTSSSGLTALTGNELVTGQIFSVTWDGTVFELISAVNNAQVSSTCSFQGLTIANNAGTPNTNIDVVWTAAVLNVTSTGAAVKAGAQSFTINLTTGAVTSAANGMDGEARGTTSNVIFLYAIYNGATFAGLGSLSATTPTLPSGYTYACYMGSMKTDGSGNLYGTKQFGNEVRYISGGNLLTAGLPVIKSGTTTGAANCGTTTPVYQAFTIRGNTAATTFVPSVANMVYLVLLSTSGNTSSVAPNTNYNLTNGFYMSLLSTAIGTWPFSMMMEANTVQYCQLAATSALYSAGWREPVSAP